MNPNARESILSVATMIAQSRGYSGLNLRDIAEEVGIKAASIYYHFSGKADLAAAVAKRYWEDGAAALVAISQESPDPANALHRFPQNLPSIARSRQSSLAGQLHGRRDR